MDVDRNKLGEDIVGDVIDRELNKEIMGTVVDMRTLAAEKPSDPEVRIHVVTCYNSTH